MNLVDELHAIARALHDAGITYAVCGGIAVTIHGATRTTKDSPQDEADIQKLEQPDEG